MEGDGGVTVLSFQNAQPAIPRLRPRLLTVLSLGVVRGSRSPRRPKTPELNPKSRTGRTVPALLSSPPRTPHRRNPMDAFLQDVRYAVRTLRKSPTFTIIAVVCLAVGIATNTTLFSCFDAIVLRPFPFTDPDRLVALWDFNPKNGNRDGVSYLNYLDWRDQSRSFSGIAAYSGRSVAITEGTEPARLDGQLITGNLFSLLGVRPQLGRLFRADEDTQGAAGVVLLSDAAWRRLYDGDPSVVGRVISVNGEPHTVVGIMPPDFKFPDRSEIWLPMAPLLHADHRDWRSLQMVGRLKAGVTIAQANTELPALTRRLDAQYGVTNND